MLDSLDPSRYGPADVTKAVLCYRRLGITDSKWADRAAELYRTDPKRFVLDSFPSVCDVPAERSTQERVCIGLAECQGLPYDTRLRFAERALASGSGRAAIATAELLKEKDPLRAMRILLGHDTDGRTAGKIRDLYETLSGRREDDLLALELYRACSDRGRIPEDAMSELRRRFLRGGTRKMSRRKEDFGNRADAKTSHGNEPEEKS